VSVVVDVDLGHILPLVVRHRWDGHRPMERSPASHPRDPRAASMVTVPRQLQRVRKP
jgi:hypothetical protein